MLRRPQSVPRVGSIRPSTLNVSVFSPQIWRCPKIQFSPRLRAQSRIHRPFVLGSGEHGHRKPEMLPTREESLRESSLRWLKVEYNGKSHGFDSLMLRDSCPCTRCIDPSTTQKLFDTTDIPTKIRAKDVHVNADGSFLVSWNDDIAGFENHRSYFPSEFLSGRDTLKAVDASICENNPQILWHAASLEAGRSDMTVKYDDYIADRRTLRHVIRQLYKYGIVFISDVPPISGSVASIGNRFGPLMRTIYGATWDVRSLPSAKNVADTSSNLGFHMDLLYYKEPPRLQILHFLKQSRQGGESLFSDAFTAVSTLVMNNMDSPKPASDAQMSERGRSVLALTQFMLPFHYKNNDQWLEYSHPTIVINKALKGRSWSKSSENLMDPSKFQSALQAVRWSPPFQAPLPMPPALREDRVPASDYWIRGARLLKQEFERKEAVFETIMQEGTCVIFDNWRVLHARRAFSGGERWLRGTYIDDDTFRQQVRSQLMD